ncbi:uncharacterized protein LOC127751445 isoform X2 [Frankliniella occidentalis]|uniref:Uncharacterized protein LOC127751445 isoform X2 n=1 Tax=Frankliniella occidentalis TaxID=133901 RepID=A0A9C6X8F9_FRAOC|nr:uncharacterized protein LOC127751445 isoform X2 [Frankliniella occidentalis]
MPPKSRKPVRKRFVKKKRTTLSPNINTDPPDSVQEEPSALVSSDAPSTSNSNLGCQSRTFESDHDYVTASPSASEAEVIMEDGAQEKPPESVLPSVSVDLLMDIKGKVDWFLHQNWISIVQQDSITVVFVCPGKNILIQRSLVFESNGNVEVFVHGEKVDVNPFMEGLDVFEPLEEKNVNQFVDRMVTVINNLRSMQICSGYDDEKFKSVWSQCSQGFVDKNPFREYRYEETFRSPSCLRLVHHRKWRCTECSKLYKPLKRKSLSAAVDRPKLHTANKYLTEEQMLTKLADQANTINTANRKISHMTERMQLMLTKSGVNLDNDLSDNLTELLESGQMTEAKSVFLQQQVKASQKKNMVGMRWHPTMIRFALAIHLTSPAAYELMRDTGMLKLPSGRTLFDYSHVKPVQEGIDQYVLDSLGERVSKF